MAKILMSPRGGNGGGKVKLLSGTFVIFWAGCRVQAKSYKKGSHRSGKIREEFKTFQPVSSASAKVHEEKEVHRSEPTILSKRFPQEICQIPSLAQW